MKTCSKCGEEKPRSEFRKRGDGKGRDGLRSRCKTCDDGARRWYWKNRERRQAYVRANRHLFREQARRRKADPVRHARHREMERARRARDPESSAKVRAWQREHPEVTRENYRRNGAKKRARKHDAFVEPVEPLVVLELHDGVCGICREDVDPFEFQVDHIKPLARGGLHCYANCQPAHPRCNAAKGARVPE